MRRWREGLDVESHPSDKGAMSAWGTLCECWWRGPSAEIGEADTDTQAMLCECGDDQWSSNLSQWRIFTPGKCQ